MDVPPATGPYKAMRDHVAFYAEPMDACFVDDERVAPQPGNFYGGWVTQQRRRPFQGRAGDGWMVRRRYREDVPREHRSTETDT